MQYTIEKTDAHTRVITITVPASEKEEDINEMVGKTCTEAIDSLGEEIVSTPEIRILQNEEGKDFIYTATVATRPEVKMGVYKGITVVRPSLNITEDEFKEAVAEKKRRQAAYVPIGEDRPVQSGDQVDLDFEGFCDGVAFEGGKGEHYPLVIGSGSFIPGFEDQLIGARVNEDIDVNVTFPEAYTPALAGKDAVFKCKIHEIKKEILPEIDDELASDVSEFETLAEYKKDLKKKLQEQADATDLSVMKDRALEKLYESNDIEVPEVMIAGEIDNMLYDMNQNLAAQGLGLQQYMEWTGKTIEEVREETKPEAEKRVKTRILLKNIIRQEGLEAGDDEIQDLMKEFGEQYGMTIDQVKEMAGAETEKYFKEDAQTKKAIDLIFDNAKQTAPEKEKKAAPKKTKKAEKEDK